MTTIKSMRPSLRIIAWGIGIAVLVAAACWGGRIFCQSSGALAQTTRVGIVDIQLVLQTPKLVEMNKHLSEKLKPQQEALLKLQQDYLQAKNNLKKNESVLSEAARKQQTEALTQREKALQEKSEKIERDFSAAQTRFNEKFTQILSKIAHKNKITVLLHKGATLYIDSALDITSQVIGAIKNVELL